MQQKSHNGYDKTVRWTANYICHVVTIGARRNTYSARTRLYLSENNLETIWGRVNKLACIEKAGESRGKWMCRSSEACLSKLCCKETAVGVDQCLMSNPPSGCVWLEGGATTQNSHTKHKMLSRKQKWSQKSLYVLLCCRRFHLSMNTFSNEDVCLSSVCTAEMLSWVKRCSESLEQSVRTTA